MLSLGLSSEWGTSLSVRTPNDNTKELDYELSIKLNDTNGKIQYLLKRDWERELGEKYIDDVIHLQHQVLGYMYYGVDYVNKESKNIDYITYNIGATIDYFKAGASFKEIDNIFDIKDADYIPKPDLLPYKKVVNKFKIIPHNTIMIDDIKANLVTAKQLGIKTIHVTKQTSESIKNNM